MKKILHLIAILLWVASVSAQTLKLQQSHWQQHVSYTIHVTLDDTKNSLYAVEQFRYTNHSPDVLREMYIHLWPNAYKDNHTAFAKQHLENGKTDVEYAAEKDRGFIDSLHFTVDGMDVKVETTADADICKIILNKPLEPEQSVVVATPFRVKLPYVFSRMGVEKGMYCITQWYPKPAVYDVNGWNPIPYLDQGEFYSEFGKMDVSITLPSDYVLAATGNMMDQAEMDWLSKKIVDNDTKNPYENTKTIRFIQDSVHDFAWFCSRDFKVKRGMVQLPSGRSVQTWLYAKQPNDNGVKYINEAIEFYSKHVGEYPYSIAQVVITPLKAGGGMEYPTITNCAYIDRTVIVHEVGHNWFYGILGSNERRYPWMDESINTYYENRSTDEARTDTDEHDKNDFFEKWVGFKMGGSSMTRMMYQYKARRHEDQAGNLHSMDYTSFNYGAIVYGKNPLSFRYLQAYLGDAKLDDMMRAYYQKWKFHHPLPDDFKLHAESFTGENLSWFFDDILGSERGMDYAIGGMKNNTLVLKNKTGVAAPFPLTLMKDNQAIETHWIKGFTHTYALDVSMFAKKAEGNQWAIDPNRTTLDLYPHNNYKLTQGFHGLPHFRLLPRAEQERFSQCFVTPVAAWNLFNAWMLGAYIGNDVFPQQKMSVDMVPLYSIANKDLNGYARIAFQAYSNTCRIKSEWGLSWLKFDQNKRVTYDPNIVDAYPGIYSMNSYRVAQLNSFQRIQAFATLQYKPANARSYWKQSSFLRFARIDFADITSFISPFGKDGYSVAEVRHTLAYTNKRKPAEISVGAQAIHTETQDINRLSAEVNHTFKYGLSSRSYVQIRLFGAGLFGMKTLDDRIALVAGAANGANDYMMDHALLGRTATAAGSSSILANQVIMKDAGFRNFAGVDYSLSKSWVTACNVTLPIPVKLLPIGIYADVSYAKNTSDELSTLYNTGVYVSLFGNFLNMYLPVKYSNQTNSSGTPISFTMKLEMADLIHLVRNFEMD